MTKKEIEALKEVQRTCRAADKLIQSILERHTIEQGESQTEQESEQLIQNCKKANQLADSIVKKADLGHIVAEILHELGVPAHVKGYKYLISGIKLAVRDSYYMDQITKFLYPSIAEEYKTTPSRVERAIRHAIEISNFQFSEDSEIIYKIFGNSISKEKSRPTNSQYIAAIADYVLRNFEFAKS